MNKLTSRLVAVALSLAFFLPVQAQEGAVSLRGSQSKNNLDKTDSLAFASLPKPVPGQIGRLDFVPNVGQWPEQVAFRASGKNAVVWITESGVDQVLTRAIGEKPVRDVETIIDQYESNAPPQSFEYLKISFTFGSSNQIKSYGLDVVDGKWVNFIHGNNATDWHTGVPVYSRVAMPSVYEKVDVQCYGNGGDLEYDFVLAPGASPEVIQVNVEGAEALFLDSDGSLVCRTPWGDVCQKAPVTYQQVGNIRRPVASSFRVNANGTVGFEVLGEYNRSLPLVIDPVLNFATYLGGSDDDVSYGVAQAPNGDVIVTGATASADFPISNAFQGTLVGTTWDAMIARYAADGQSASWVTYLGGDGDDFAYAVDVDANDNVYLVGRTGSTDFPLQNALFTDLAGNDVFVTSLSGDGTTLNYSTYFGGDNFDVGWDIAVTGAGAANIVGYTLSTDLPVLLSVQDTLAGSWDAFLTKFAVDGSSVDYSTYLGGARTDIAQAVVLDASDRALVTGYTLSADFPTVGAYQDNLSSPNVSDMFVSRINTTIGALSYSTYLGGVESEFGADIAVRPDGSMYVLGRTFSSNWPTVNPIQANLSGSVDLALARINATGTSLLFSTFLGGDSTEEASGLGLDADGRVFVAAQTASDDFPAIEAFQDTFAGGEYDVVVTRLNASLTNIDYSTYLGGAGSDKCHAVAVADTTIIYLVGETGSADFPVKRALQGGAGGGNEAYLSLVIGDCIDTDEDGVCDVDDNCPEMANTDQLDSDLDEVGNVCDPCPLDGDNDADGDGFCANEDNCPDLNNPGQLDPDGDGYGELCDNCPEDFNPNQTDTDEDGIGDSCDWCPNDFFNDIDADSICGDIDNCPGTFNPDQTDLDSNGIGDVCEGCCVGSTGNVDCETPESVDIADLTRLINYLFVNFQPLCCPGEANMDGSTDGVVDISDLNSLINHLFVTFEPLLPCL